MVGLPAEGLAGGEQNAQMPWQRSSASRSLSLVGSLMSGIVMLRKSSFAPRSAQVVAKVLLCLIQDLGGGQEPRVGSSGRVGGGEVPKDVNGA
jgi:hypothetical protein